jgi:hypothetical protein
MRARLLGLGFVLLATSAVIPACAEGTAEPVTDVMPLAAQKEGCGACPTGYVCSGNTCMEANTDFDQDGVIALADCDDRDPSVRPGAKEICNGKDDNCDGRIDEGFDHDGDGWVSCAVGSRLADCNDEDRLINPAAAEVCNGKDDNCDGRIDESIDADNDGFFGCARDGAPADCDDTDAKVKPGATEICNGKDDDCNGKVDEIPALLSGSISAPVNPHWMLAGAATFANAWAQLTPDETYKAGALWWNAAYLFDTFEVSTSFWMPKRADCADGFTFAFVPGTDVTKVGEAGYGFGAKGLGGFAVAIDTFANPGEPTAPFLVVLDAQTGAHLFRQGIPDVRDAREHVLRVALDNGKINVWLDAVGYVSELALNGYAPFVGHWGFTAGTGGSTCTHWVRNAKMSFPNGQGCVP